jgi:hypothetical protein
MSSLDAILRERHYSLMADELPLAAGGTWFEDVRGPERKLRISVHDEPGGVRIILSVWRGAICRASFQVDVEDVTDLIEVLASATQHDESQLEAIVAHLRDAIRRAWHHDLAEVVPLPLA